jgi:hypothetical protein
MRPKFWFYSTLLVLKVVETICDGNDRYSRILENIKKFFLKKQYRQLYRKEDWRKNF